MIAKFKNMDVTWRCSSEEVPNWMSVSFDDRSWAIASYVDHAIHSPVRFPAEKWMWIEGSDTMFCRAHIGKTPSYSKVAALRVCIHISHCGDNAAVQSKKKNSICSLVKKKIGLL